ncbi:unnamed protein product [Gordionus sp. m RMFG-2023]
MLCTLLTPIRLTIVQICSTSEEIDQPESHELFLLGTQIGLSLVLEIRSWANEAGMPYAMVLKRGKTEANLILQLNVCGQVSAAVTGRSMDAR